MHPNLPTTPNFSRNWLHKTQRRPVKPKRSVQYGLLYTDVLQIQSLNVHAILTTKRLVKFQLSGPF